MCMGMLTLIKFIQFLKKIPSSETFINKRQYRTQNRSENIPNNRYNSKISIILAEI